MKQTVYLDKVHFLITNKYNRQERFGLVVEPFTRLTASETEQLVDVKVSQIVHTRRGKKRNRLAVYGKTTLTVKLSSDANILIDVASSTVEVLSVLRGNKKVYQVDARGYSVSATVINPNRSNQNSEKKEEVSTEGL